MTKQKSKRLAIGWADQTTDFAGSGFRTQFLRRKTLFLNFNLSFCILIFNL